MINIIILGDNVKGDLASIVKEAISLTPMTDERTAEKINSIDKKIANIEKTAAFVVVDKETGDKALRVGADIIYKTTK